MSRQVISPAPRPFSAINEMFAETYGFLIRTNAIRTFTADTNQQAIWTDPAGGALTLAAGCYKFEAFVSMDSMDATSGNGLWSLKGAGTATLTQVLQLTMGGDVALDTIVAISGVATTAELVGAVNSSTATTATVYTFRVVGAFTVTVAGTIIPSFAQTTSAAAKTKVGSYFHCWPLGPVDVVSVGAWA